LITRDLKKGYDHLEVQGKLILNISTDLSSPGAFSKNLSSPEASSKLPPTGYGEVYRKRSLPEIAAELNRDHHPQQPPTTAAHSELPGTALKATPDYYEQQRAQQLSPIPSTATAFGPPIPPSSRIPSIRLSFITANDQAKFVQLFESAVGNEVALSGEQARDILLRSKLSSDDLSTIWLEIHP
jgi:hypothetical protein